MHNLLLALLLVLVTAVWGWTFVVVKDAVAVYGVVGFLAIRFTIGCAVMAGPGAWKMTRRSAAVGTGIGVVLAAAYLLQTFGLRLTTPTNCGLITGLFVVFAPIVNRLLFGVRTGRIFWSAVAASVVGLGLLTGAGPTPLCMGDLLTLGGAVCFGLHIALLDRYASHHDATALALAQMGSAALLFWILCAATETLKWPTHQVWFALLITGVLATAVAFLVQTYVQQRLPAVRTAVIISMEPVFATVFGYLLAGDRLVGIQIAGAVLMIGAVVLGEVGPAVARRRNSHHQEAGERGA